jgi:SAM-dependent methyltransferase
MTVIRELWYLPRPNGTKYRGSFPLHFEKRLFGMYHPASILQPFGGKAEYGVCCDLNLEVSPDVLCDAHNLPFKDNSFDFVLCDPPYSTDLSGKLYKTGEVRDKQYIGEAFRVCKVGGHIGLYHWVMQPRPKGTRYDRVIVIITRIRHHARFCCIFQKVEALFNEIFGKT